MRLTSKFTTLAAGAALAASTAFTAFAAEVTLTISSWAPPSHGVNAIIWPAMTKMIEEATNGRVTAEIKYGLTSPPAQYDLILDGGADFAWVFHGYTPGRFVATKMIELPGYMGSAEAASVAYWRAHEKYFAGLNEHKGVKVAGLMTHGEGVLHTSKDIKSLADINGMKLRIGGGVAGDTGAALGATGINVPAPKVYETLASNAADGVMMPMEGKLSFKFYEVAKNTYTVPGGFYRGSFAIIMNQAAFDNLTADEQVALDKLFGENLSRVAGAAWDAMDAAGLGKLNAEADNHLIEASAEDVAAFNAIAAPIIDGVKAEVNALGLNADEVQAFIADQMKNY
ncbi:MAG: TRAP transporter substrate-binding protein [Rhodobacteraceae bacterium]|nr:TRAP transporter substrate-binding protein [Paracoccaceae bacterium]